MLSLSPLTCENSLALSHEGWVLSEKLIIRVRDNLCHGWLSQRGAAVRLGPHPWWGQNNWTDPTTPVTAAPQRGHQRLRAQQSYSVSSRKDKQQNLSENTLLCLCTFAMSLMSSRGLEMNQDVQIRNQIYAALRCVMEMILD